jgi:hypothetical protein
MICVGGGGWTVDLKEWDGTVWISIPTAASLPARPNVLRAYTYHALQYDHRSGKLVLFGRTERLNAGNLVAVEPLSWEWDVLSGWVALPPSGTVGSYSRMWFDDCRGQLMRQDYAYLGATSTVSVRGSTGLWQSVAVSGAPSLGGFIGNRGGYDPVRSRFYSLFAGGSGYFTDLHPADYDTHATGCAAPTSPTLRLSKTWTRPWLGGTLSVDVNPCPQSFAVLATGFSDQQYGGATLPYDLTASGMPGCQLRIAPEHLLPAYGAAGTVTFTLPIPNAPVLVGTSFWQQAFVMAPGTNAAGVLLSNSMRGRIGKSH